MEEAAQNFLTLPWEVRAMDHGADVTENCDGVDAVLDHCGRLLYANTIFSMTLLQISHAQSQEKMDGWTSPELNGQTYEWVMKIVRQGVVRPTRYFDHKHDLFGMLIAELKQGTDHIEVSRSH